MQAGAGLSFLIVWSCVSSSWPYFDDVYSGGATNFFLPAAAWLGLDAARMAVCLATSYFHRREPDAYFTFGYARHTEMVRMLAGLSAILLAMRSLLHGFSAGSGGGYIGTGVGSSPTALEYIDRLQQASHDLASIHGIGGGGDVKAAITAAAAAAAAHVGNNNNNNNYVLLHKQHQQQQHQQISLTIASLLCIFLMLLRVACIQLERVSVGGTWSACTTRRELLVYASVLVTCWLAAAAAAAATTTSTSQSTSPFFGSASLLSLIASLGSAIALCWLAWPVVLRAASLFLQAVPHRLSLSVAQAMHSVSTLEGVLSVERECFWEVSPGRLAGTLTVRVARNADAMHVTNAVSHRLEDLVDLDLLSVAVVKTQHDVNNDQKSPATAVAISVPS